MHASRALRWCRVSAAWLDLPPRAVSVDGVDGSDGLGGSDGTPLDVLSRTVRWLARYIRTTSDHDIELLALWVLHTHVVDKVYTTPRLLIDSPMPGSGKTTVLEHIQRLGFRPMQAASLSSPALLARVIDQGVRTVCIDECDRNLDPKREGVGELVAVINSGYKRGATRPVLVPSKGGEWAVSEMSTFAPIAMAGNQPDLPDDTRSRTLRVLLMPDLDGTVEESDWEQIEPNAADLKALIEEWAANYGEAVAGASGELPGEVKGRARERWKPLKKVAQAVGYGWPEKVDALAMRDLERESLEREDGAVRDKPAIVALKDVMTVWPEGREHLTSETLVRFLIAESPEQWGATSSYGRALTPQRLGRMLSSNFGIHTGKTSTGERVYFHTAFLTVWGRLGVKPPRASTPSTPSGGTA